MLLGDFGLSVPSPPSGRWTATPDLVVSCRCQVGYCFRMDSLPLSNGGVDCTRLCLLLMCPQMVHGSWFPLQSTTRLLTSCGGVSWTRAGSNFCLSRSPLPAAPSFCALDLSVGFLFPSNFVFLEGRHSLFYLTFSVFNTAHRVL